MKHCLFDKANDNLLVQAYGYFPESINAVRSFLTEIFKELRKEKIKIEYIFRDWGLFSKTVGHNCGGNHPCMCGLHLNDFCNYSMTKLNLIPTLKELLFMISQKSDSYLNEIGWQKPPPYFECETFDEFRNLLNKYNSVDNLLKEYYLDQLKDGKDVMHIIRYICINIIKFLKSEKGFNVELFEENKLKVLILLLSNNFIDFKQKIKT